MVGQGGSVEAAREEEMETCVKVLRMIESKLKVVRTGCEIIWQVGRTC
jgi:hypothetical protein